MKFFNVCVLTLLTVAASVGVANKNHPVVRVIGMIEGLISKAEEEGISEALAYEKYVRQCGLNKGVLTKAIDEANAKIDELSDTIEAKTKLNATLSKEIAGLIAEDLANEATITKQKGQRDAANSLYKKTSGELKSTITAIQQALAALESAEKKTEKSFLAKGTKVERSRKVLALIQQQVKDIPFGDLAAHVDKYDFKSENVIELLKKLEADFQTELLETEKAETNSLNAHSLSKESLDNMQTAVAKSKGAKESAKTEAEKDLNDAKQAKSEEEADKKADEATLASVKEACRIKKEEWEKRSATRSDEITAMKTAIKIMSKVTGVQTKAPENPVPPPSPVAFLQLVAAPKNGDRRSKAISRMINMLLTTAAAERSTMLKRFAVEVSAKLKAPYDDYVFQPVINEIEKMIFHLQEEQKAEDDHKNWCDKDLAKTETMEDNHEDKEEMLDAKLTEEKAKVQTLKSDITKQEKMIADIKEFQAEATEIRKVGKKENKVALEDSEAAQEALANAIAVLTEFYKSSGEVAKEPYEFVQEPVVLPKNPATWDSEYTAVTDPKNAEKGILTVLGQVAKDFANMAADIKAQESADQKAYDEEMSNMDIEKARRTQDVQEKTLEKSHRSSMIKELSTELKHTKAELAKTSEYLADLQKACVDSDSTYADRKAARDKEITALRESEGILNEAFKKPAPPATNNTFLQISRHLQ